MPVRLIARDADAAADILTFAGRAARLADSAIRLQAAHGTLLMTAAPLAPRGLLDATPTVLAMRAATVDAELECDLVVEASALGRDVIAPEAVTLPETAVSRAWAGVTPPRTGWSAAGSIPAATLAARAQYGIAAVADAVPTDAGEDAVRVVRAGVWAVPDPALQDCALGVAFAAFALGFIGGEEDAAVLTCGPWTRISLRRGHVLLRGAARSGLTAVRATGRSSA